MAQILGRVEYGSDKPSRFFIHDDTSGWSFPQLFDDPKQAWQAYDQGRSQRLGAPIPKQNKLIHAIRKVLAHSRDFDADGSICGRPRFGIATEDQLLWPLSEGYEESNYSLLRVDGALHVAQEVSGGFSGDYDRPRCDDHWKYSPDSERLDFEQVFGQTLDMCPNCLKILLT